MEVTNASLYKGIDAAVVGSRLGDIGYTVQQFCEKEHGYGVVRELVGHGIGRELHEDPQVPNYGRRGKGAKMRDGLVIAIEPMVNLGKRGVRQHKDGWTIITKDKSVSAHFEHTIAVRESGPDILSNHDRISKETVKNNNLQAIDSDVRELAQD